MQEIVLIKRDSCLFNRLHGHSAFHPPSPSVVAEDI